MSPGHYVKIHINTGNIKSYNEEQLSCYKIKLSHERCAQILCNETISEKNKNWLKFLHITVHP